MVHIQQKLGVSERRTCRVLTQPRSVQRHKSNKSGHEELLRRDVVRLASTYGRYGYRRITALLRTEEDCDRLMRRMYRLSAIVRLEEAALKQAGGAAR